VKTLFSVDALLAAYSTMTFAAENETVVPRKNVPIQNNPVVQDNPIKSITTVPIKPEPEKPVQAPNPKWPDLDMFKSLAILKTLPPVEYDRFYDGVELIIKVVSELEEMPRLCPGLPAYNLMGCAHAGGFNKCTIILRDDAYIRSLGWTTALVLRHELAHCNGWPKTHPGIR
jgi:hypothetical protein